MPANDYALPYLYKVCILGDGEFFAARVDEMRRSFRSTKRAPTSSPWSGLIRMAADKFSTMARISNMNDAQRSLPLICTLSSGAHGADILLALMDIGPSMPLPTQQACAQACAQSGNPRALDAILDIAGPVIAGEWLIQLSLAARSAGYICLSQRLDERQLALVESCELAAQSPNPIPQQPLSSSSRL